MIRNYFKITFRNLKRQKAFAFINIFSLALGITTSILVGLYVFHEFSYDRFHKDSEKLYRVMLDFKMGTNALSGPVSPAPMAQEIVRQLPEVKSALRIHSQGNREIKTDDQAFFVDRFFHADSNFFDFFNVKFLEGNPSTALIKPNSAVLTKQMSEKMFGTENCLGRTFMISNSDSSVFEVTAVVEPLPDNCHIHFDILTSMAGYSDSKSPMWLSNNYYTYVKLKENTNTKEFSKKLTKMFQLNASPQLLKFFNIRPEEFLKAGNRSDYGVQKVTDIHLKSHLNFEIEQNGSIVYVSIFILVAIFVLLNACINFTNLATARSTNRAKEVGLRKVLGTDRKNLIFQFLAEAIFISYLSVLLAILMTELLLPPFNNLLNIHLHLSISDYLKLLPYIFLFATLVGIISGAYPAFYLSSFQPNDALRKKIFQGSSRNWLRNTLVIFQFTVSIILFLGTILVSSQLKFLQHKNLGFDKDRLMVVERTYPLKNNVKVFIDELQKCPTIENVTLSSDIPGRNFGDQGFLAEGKNSTETYVINTMGVDDNYLKTMGMKVIKGRFFSKQFPGDSTSVVINESTAHYLGMENPVGKQLFTPGTKNSRTSLTIIGVIDDFHYESLHKPVNPLLLFQNPRYYDGYINIRIANGKEKEALAFVNTTWASLVPDAALQYFYYGDQFQMLYKKEIETQRLMNVFAFVAIIIASLGLFGLVAFMAERRTKEIGIRKVMGSSVWSIIELMTSEVTVLVLISYIIAAPLSFLWMKHWLTQYAYKTAIHPMLFVIALVFALVMAWLTISVLAFRAATRNPVDALRYE